MADDLTPEGKSVATGTRMSALVLHYAETCNSVGEDEETILTDLLADLRHWARYTVVDFERCNERAALHFYAEQPGDDDA